MIRTSNFVRKALRGGSALQALALMGAGVAALSVVAPASAQDYSQVNATGRIQGTDGKPIAGATVTITSNAQGTSRTVTTGATARSVHRRCSRAHIPSLSQPTAMTASPTATLL
ncbi:carboxypeptidase-like regulatory domain-containing protein [Sphingomonas sp. 22R3R2A-7]|uniref:carboxypeptidase-like regulatory domain-containing protein n=1 Tax=Sphingomonas sp. 22R3R2A-7 TaxID=3050230 RepID=UPI002FE0CF6C